MGLKFSIPYQIPFYETDITHASGKITALIGFFIASIWYAVRISGKYG